MRRLTISRTLLVITAVIAAYVATFRLNIIVELVAWAFSLAAAGFFPALVMGIWSKKTTKTAAILGMILGLGVTLFYMIGNRFYGLNWFGIKHISSAIFGLPVGFITMWLVSKFTPSASKELQDFVESVRYPKGAVRVAEE